MKQTQQNAPAFVRHDSSMLGESYYEALHPSGLRILVCPKDMTGCYASLGVGYGAVHREAGMPCGIAHFLEHKMFERADGSEEDNHFAALGAEVNAYTTYNRTAYEFSCTDNFADALVSLLHMTDRLHITKTSVEREKSIIAEEIRMDLDDPWERVSHELLAAMYERHPVREEICGSEQDIAAITPALLRKAFAAHYGLCRSVLSVCGPITPEEVYAAVERFCAERPARPPHRLPRGSVEPFSCPEEPRGVYRVHTEIWMNRDGEPAADGGADSSNPLFAVGIKLRSVPADPEGQLRADICLSILSEMLFSESGDFYNRLFESGLIQPCTSYGSAVGADCGDIHFTGESDCPGRVEEAFLDYMQTLHREGLSRNDFERCRRAEYADYVAGFDSTDSIGGYLTTFALDGLDLFGYLSVAESVTFEDVTALFEETFLPSQYAFVVLHPAKT